MTTPKPTKEDVEAMAATLCLVDAESRHDLRYYTAGQMHWRMAHPVIKRCVARLINDSTKRLRRTVREDLMRYAVKYGLKTYGAAADELLTVVWRFKVSPTMSDEMKAAMVQAGYEHASDWVRDTCMAEVARLQAKAGKA